MQNKEAISSEDTPVKLVDDILSGLSCEEWIVTDNIAGLVWFFPTEQEARDFVDGQGDDEGLTIEKGE